MTQILRFLLSFSLLLTTFRLTAQTPSGQPVEMADVLHQNGKIYLVVLVLLTIFAGVLYMLVRIERKLNRLENNK